MVAGCAANIAKMILFVLNALVWVVSIALIGVGGYVLARQDQYSSIFGSGTNTLVIVCGTVIGVGCLIFLVAFCGCCGAMKESGCLLKIYIAIMIILVILEVVGGILALVFRNSIEETLEKEMRTQIKENYGKDDQKALTDFMDSLQKEGCCGVANYTDYRDSNFQKVNSTKFVPKSCCKENTLDTCNNKTDDDIADKSKIYTKGCLPTVVKFFQDNFLYVGAAALALVAFEILASIFACCVISGISNGEYE